MYISGHIADQVSEFNKYTKREKLGNLSTYTQQFGNIYT